MSKHESVTVDYIPNCDICGNKAYADANIGFGWGSVCKQHFNDYGCKLGLGKGQRYILSNEVKVSA